MAKKLTPKQLRDQAKSLIKKAQDEEEKRYLRVGRLIEKELLVGDFNPSDLGGLIAQTRKILYE